MRTNVPEKVTAILNDLKKEDCLSVTRLTVLKKWFEEPSRLISFASFVAKKAISKKGKIKNKVEINLFARAKKLFAGVDIYHPKINQKIAEALLDDLSEYQNDFERISWNQVRIIKNWQLLLIEEAIEVFRYSPDCINFGYKLASDYFNDYDPSYGTGLNRKSKDKLKEFIQFMFAKEAKEATKKQDKFNTKKFNKSKAC